MQYREILILKKPYLIIVVEFYTDYVYVPPLPAALAEPKIRLILASEAVHSDMLAKLWDVVDYHIDLCRASKGGPIEHL